MKNLDDLVPPLDLCKRIPAGEFADSAFCWIDVGHTCVLPIDVIPPERHPFIELRRYTIQGDEIPAPTLAEILEKLPSHYKVRMKYSRDEKLVFSVFAGEEIERDMNAASAALKVWLNLNANFKTEKGRK